MQTAQGRTCDFFSPTMFLFPLISLNKWYYPPPDGLSQAPSYCPEFLLVPHTSHPRNQQILLTYLQNIPNFPTSHHLSYNLVWATIISLLNHCNSILMGLLALILAASAAMLGYSGCILHKGTIALDVPFLSQTHTNLHRSMQMSTDIIGFLAPNLRAEDESLLLHKPVPVCMVLYRLQRAHVHTHAPSFIPFPQHPPHWLSLCKLISVSFIVFVIYL